MFQLFNMCLINIKYIIILKRASNISIRLTLLLVDLFVLLNNLGDMPIFFPFQLFYFVI